MRLVSGPHNAHGWIIASLIVGCALLWGAVVVVRGLDRVLTPAAVVTTVWLLLRSRLWSMLRMAVLGHDAGFAHGYAAGLREGLGLRSRLASIAGRKVPGQPSSE